MDQELGKRFNYPRPISEPPSPTHSMRRNHHEISWLTASYHKEIEKLKSTKDQEVQTDFDLQKRNAIVRKSLEILEITDVERGTDIEVTFEKNLEFTDSDHESFQTPSDYLEPLNEAVVQQIDQLIAKLGDCVEATE
ncbi:jg14652 [Pararge aegeria aegeria]|uniref:Jg14652 protein n=1 Tax=Pararge aegeria aegeria TaxID=348720 RepID=A0A8S4R0Q3_9NEOP|nr:jg14652 [Pararge aegeria aegeria]